MSLTPFKIEIYCPQMCSPQVVLDCAPCFTQAWLAEAALHRFHLLHPETGPQEGGKSSLCPEESSGALHATQDRSSVMLVLMKDKTNKLKPQ